MLSEEQLAKWELLASNALGSAWRVSKIKSDLYPDGVLSVRGQDDVEVCGPIAKEDAAFIAAARTAVPALIKEVRELRASLNREVEHLTISIHERLQLEKQIDWLCKNIPYERAFVMIHDYDYVTPCQYMIDRKAKRKCPLWEDPNYGTFSFAENFPEQTFEQWLEYIDSGEGYTVCKCEDAAKCWKEAARKVTEGK